MKTPCNFCNNAQQSIDYKDTEMLRKFVNPHARILGRRQTGVCAKHTRALAMAIKRARFLALLPYVAR